MITDGLIDKFDCAFARIWLVNQERTTLTLMASSGLYTRLDGDFAKVPMGAYKVGKIAQHCIPFLSNQLAEESWVKDRQWAIDNKICGFAGLPLAIASNTIGVLAVFSYQPMTAEFLEALRILCSSVAVALNNARLYQQESLTKLYDCDSVSIDTSLSERISNILTNVLTGGDSGIGRAVAIAYAMEGANVAIVYNLADDDADDTRQKIEQYSSCYLIKADISSSDECRRVIDETVRHFGGLNILVNNAAYAREQAKFEDISEEQLRRVFDTNILKDKIALVTRETTLIRKIAIRQPVLKTTFISSSTG